MMKRVLNVDDSRPPPSFFFYGFTTSGFEIASLRENSLCENFDIFELLYTRTF